MWESLRADPEPPPAVPEPEVRARPAEAGEIPRAAQRLYDNAAANGWYGGILFARGPRLHSSRGTVTRIVDSIGVYLGRQVGRDLHRVAALWVEGKFESAQIWIAGQARVEVGSDAVHAWVKTNEGTG